MIKVISSLIFIVVICILIYFLNKKYKLKRDQKIIFWLLVLFWTSISTIRAFRKTYAATDISLGGLGLAIEYAIIVASGYGFASFILRLPLFIFSDILRKRKIFIQIAIVLVFITSFLVFINPTYNTLYFSSIAMGVGASMIAIFNVVFSETFDRKNASLSASILAIAPLLAEMISAPIQYIFTYNKVKEYSYLWLISGFVALITFILSFMFKEKTKETVPFSSKKIAFVLKNKIFIFLCIIGCLVSFIRFSTTGANMINYASNTLHMNPLLVAYLDTVFTSFQLLSSVLIGTYLSKKLRLESIVILALTTFSMYFIITIINTNQYITFISYSLAGFSYGAIYTSFISIALSHFDENYKNISMGIFQGFFSLGIYYGDRAYLSILKVMPENLKSIGIYYIAFIACIICIILLFIQLTYKRNV